MFRRVPSRSRLPWGTKWFFSNFPLPVIIPPLLLTYLSPPPEVCDTPDHAAHYHIPRSLSWERHLRPGARLVADGES
jgi:hypothetical protein